MHLSADPPSWCQPGCSSDPAIRRRCIWSRSAARATRSTPRSWPAGWSTAVSPWWPTREAADAVMVNTCGFVEAAKKDSVDTLLAAADLKAAGRAQAVVAVGCLAERYGRELAEAMPEADAVLGFDDYADIAERLQAILAGERHSAHVPRDRRRLLPLAPAARPVGRGCRDVPGHRAVRSRRRPGKRTAVLRRRLAGGPIGTAQDRVRLRPALHASARSRRSAAPTSPGRRPTSSPRRVGWSSEGVREVLPGQRELLLLRQGPRRHPPAGASAGRAGRASTAWTGSGSPTCSRPRCGRA